MDQKAIPSPQQQTRPFFTHPWYFLPTSQDGIPCHLAMSLAGPRLIKEAANLRHSNATGCEGGNSLLLYQHPPSEAGAFPHCFSCSPVWCCLERFLFFLLESKIAQFMEFFGLVFLGVFLFAWFFVFVLILPNIRSTFP